MFQTFKTLSEAPHAQPRVTTLLCVGENIMPLSWHMPLSREPFRYAIAVREENLSHALLHQRGSFTLNFLPFAYHEEIDACGRVHGGDVHKLSYSGLVTHGCDEDGNILLDGSDFIYVCRLYKSSVEGDHTLFFAEVSHILINNCYEGHPTLFLGRGRYATTGKSTHINPQTL